MKRIGLTQRVEVVASYQERRDCLDQNWCKLLLELGYMPIPLPNIQDQGVISSYLQTLDLDGVILTGGNDLVWTESQEAAIERDYFEKAVIQYFIKQKKPVLGVCRGMQMLNIFFAGEMIRIDNHVAQSHQVKLADGTEFNVNSYHNWGITTDKLAKELIALGHTQDGLVEYCKHKSLPVVGMMWHPERFNIDSGIGKKIINETFL